MEEWTPEEETIISRIMATETMHDPADSTGDRRISCSRIEAIRRLQRRKVAGIYREPTGLALKAARQPRKRRTAAQIAALSAGRIGKQPESIAA